MLIIAATVLLAPVRNLLGNAPLTGREWGVALLLSLIPFAAVETWILIRRLAARGRAEAV